MPACKYRVTHDTQHMASVYGQNIIKTIGSVRLARHFLSQQTVIQRYMTCTMYVASGRIPRIWSLQPDHALASAFPSVPTRIPCGDWQQIRVVHGLPLLSYRLRFIQNGTDNLLHLDLLKTDKIQLRCILDVIRLVMELLWTLSIKAEFSFEIDDCVFRLCLFCNI